MKYKFGYIGLIGRANAGKSTLINAIISQKVAITSPKPQTTRNNILGILTTPSCQLAFIDTPGIHTTKNALDKYMMKNVRSALGGADVIVYLKDCAKSLEQDEIKYIKKLIEDEQKVIVALTKIDLTQKSRVFEMLAVLSEINGICDIVPISSVNMINIDELLTAILNLLPSSDVKNFQFNEDEYTDKSIKFLVSEIIRESALYIYKEEVPHGIAIDITKFDEQKDITFIDVDIICERETHKSIIIGKSGVKIKKLGENARRKIEDLLGCKIMLKLFVKVEADWRNKPNNLNDFGYNSNFD
ncbi:MAG: GTPase Era [Clostridia bacterium]|nr:GTPase Era [Clostridia bacterium]